jgi:hypothetical protein
VIDGGQSSLNGNRREGGVRRHVAVADLSEFAASPAPDLARADAACVATSGRDRAVPTAPTQARNDFLPRSRANWPSVLSPQQYMSPVASIARVVSLAPIAMYVRLPLTRTGTSVAGQAVAKLTDDPSPNTRRYRRGYRAGVSSRPIA